MNISEAAEKVALTPVTIRYYEKIGLIPPINRKNGGVRNFGLEDLKWIEFIKCMRRAGLSVASLIRYTQLYQQGEATLEEREELLKIERQKLVEKYAEIGSTIQRLDVKIKSYEDGSILELEKNLVIKR